MAAAVEDAGRGSRSVVRSKPVVGGAAPRPLPPSVKPLGEEGVWGRKRFLQGRSRRVVALNAGRQLDLTLKRLRDGRGSQSALRSVARRHAAAGRTWPRAMVSPSRAVGADCRRPLASSPPAPAGHGRRAWGLVGAFCIAYTEVSNIRDQTRSRIRGICDVARACGRAVL